MLGLSPSAIYTLWLREIIKYRRAKSRIVGTLGMPLFFMLFLGSGFQRVRFPSLPPDIEYFDILATGIIGMMLLFGSTFAGLSVLWDRQFGFLKEIMVTPIKRISIVLGRTAGGVTISVFQASIILVIAMTMGLKVQSVSGFFLALVFMVLVSTTFVTMGLSFASLMEDMQGFQLIMNFIIFPLLLLSGVFFPLSELPRWVFYIALLDPLTYGVDGIRGALIGYSLFPIWLDLAALIFSTSIMIFIGTYLFGRVEV